MAHSKNKESYISKQSFVNHPFYEHLRFDLLLSDQLQPELKETITTFGLLWHIPCLY